MPPKPTYESLNEDPAENRRLAIYQRELMQSAATAATSEAVALQRWVLTSLLAINGAAAVAVWQGDLPPSGKILACSIFAVGLILALLTAQTSVGNLPKLLEPVHQLAFYWYSVEDDGIRDPDMEELDEMKARVDSIRRLPVMLGWLSIFCFIVGLASTGFLELTILPEKSVEAVKSK
jgi:hypothetical protein